MKKENVILGIFTILLIFSILMIIINRSQLTGFATTGTTVSNVTITSFLSISMTANLTAGIFFEDISTLPAYYENGSSNYDGYRNDSTYLLNVSTDSNTAVDFCIRANSDLRSVGGNVLYIRNETYANSTISNLTYPNIATNVSLNSTAYIRAGVNIAVGTGNYYRFWLNVPVAQAPAYYNNTVMFKGVATTAAC